jgi:D-arginine dehydrogenase
MDVLIIGGGIAGVSLAARLAGRCRVTLLEREKFLAMHTTGRSAAMYIESYGNEGVRALTRASRAFFDAPPEGFTERPILTRRPGLTVARPEDVGHIEQLLRDNPASVRPVPPEEAYARMPILRRDVFTAFAEEPDTMDIDVHALFDGFRRMALARGVEVLTNQEVLGLSHGAAGWTVETREREFTAAVIVNAAGAWAGKIGLMAGLGDRGLVPMRRTAVLIEPPPGVDVSDWMVVNDAAEAFYFKPDAGMILASPADETPVEPCDAQPEEEDVARIAWAIEQATALTVTRIRRRWAGLRTFTPQRVPIFEFDPSTDGFFWLAGQGGYGIQTSPAVSERAASLVLARL